MPITSHGKKVLTHLKQEYGSDKTAKRIFYALINKGKGGKGKHKWEGKKKK